MAVEATGSLKNQGIIIYGADRAHNAELAYDMIVNYLVVEDINLTKKHILANTYPNFMKIGLIDDRSEIPIDDTRAITQFLAQKPTLEGRRAVLVEDAENMSRNAANSILKVVEEMPTDSIFVLTTTSLSLILPTIRSRCLKIYAKTQGPMVSGYPDVTEYIKSKLPNIDTEYVKQVIVFIESGCKNLTAFAKQHAETAEEFLEVMSAYHFYMASKKQDQAAADKVLFLQELSYYLRNASPDKQNTIIAACVPT
ncbi:MAG: DNA polymerase III subunit [Holosporales bacterium]|jgi:DNA polymerase III delta prime subunit|nr:DNA polymerase III subunit [Holosporales bacterium]